MLLLLGLSVTPGLFNVATKTGFCVVVGDGRVKIVVGGLVSVGAGGLGLGAGMLGGAVGTLNVVPFVIVVAIPA